jgi:hypothetical protein
MSIPVIKRTRPINYYNYVTFVWFDECCGNQISERLRFIWKFAEEHGMPIAPVENEDQAGFIMKQEDWMWLFENFETMPVTFLLPGATVVKRYFDDLYDWPWNDGEITLRQECIVRKCFPPEVAKDLLGGKVRSMKSLGIRGSGDFHDKSSARIYPNWLQQMFEGLSAGTMREDNVNGIRVRPRADEKPGVQIFEYSGSWPYLEMYYAVMIGKDLMDITNQLHGKVNFYRHRSWKDTREYIDRLSGQLLLLGKLFDGRIDDPKINSEWEENESVWITWREPEAYNKDLEDNLQRAKNAKAEGTLDELLKHSGFHSMEEVQEYYDNNYVTHEKITNEQYWDLTYEFAKRVFPKISGGQHLELVPIWRA